MDKPKRPQYAQSPRKSVVPIYNTTFKMQEVEVSAHFSPLHIATS